jgi:hypothetical protein
MPNLIILRNFDSLWQAEQAQTLLKTHGIISVVQAGNPGSLGFPLVGNKDLFVAVADAARANMILDTYLPN